jgi:ribonuclease HII
MARRRAPESGQLGLGLEDVAPGTAAGAADRGLACGVDEAGRGPLAGPVFAAAVILDPGTPIDGLRDSKTLSAARREALASLIRERALAWSVASATVAEIDALNILQATMLAMRRAVEALDPAPALARVDGNRAPQGLACRVQTLVRGDALDPAISAASILAKVARDEALRALHEAFPAWRFDLHKGYPTAAHLALLREHGACPEHRRSFGPVRAVLAVGQGVPDGAAAHAAQRAARGSRTGPVGPASPPARQARR